MITRRNKQTRKITVAKDYVPPKVVSPDGRIFLNARGGPYKYRVPLPATVDNLRLVEAGIL